MAGAPLQTLSWAYALRAGAEPQELRALMSQMEMGEVAVAGHAVALAHWHEVLPQPCSNPLSRRLCHCQAVHFARASAHRALVSPA